MSYLTPMTRADEMPGETDVLIVGGGPAGALLSCLLARRGIACVVVEKQTDLERSFRGETIAAPSVDSLTALGFGPALAEHGFLETEAVITRFEGRDVMRIDYGRLGQGTLPIDIPQPALISAFGRAAAEHGSRYVAGWTLSALERDEDGTVIGGTFKAGRERASIRARLVVGADGRFSKTRKESGLEADVRPMHRDFMSFLLPRPAGWGDTAELVVDHDKHLVVLPTFPDQLRIGHNLPKRGLGELRKAGFTAFQDSIAAMDPRLADLVREHLSGWDDCGFLEIFTAEMEQWAIDGLVLIGDAAHTATPILGQGVNLALQDAIAIVPVIAEALGSTGQVPAAAFAQFVASRRKHKLFVTRFQRIQEGQLATGSAMGVVLRRLRYRLLNALPIKYAIFDRVINARHDIDQMDLDLAHCADTAASLSA